MSSDYSHNKPKIAGSFPDDSVILSGEGSAGFSRVEEFITVDRLKDEFLFGIPLYSPVTQQTMSDETLKRIIRKAASQVELKTKVDVFPVQRIKKIDWDRTKYLQGWNMLNVEHQNVTSVQEISIRAANSADSNNPNSQEGSVLYNVPLEWISMDRARNGILTMVPLQVTYNSSTTVGAGVTGAAAPLFAVFSKLNHIPGFWTIKFTTGFPENSIPSPINQLVGVYAALEVLSILGPSNRYNTQSVGLDAASQSVSTPGVQIYSTRAADLQAQKSELENLIKSRFNTKIFMTHI